MLALVERVETRNPNPSGRHKIPPPRWSSRAPSGRGLSEEVSSSLCFASWLSEFRVAFRGFRVSGVCKAFGSGFLGPLVSRVYKI